MSGWSDNQYSGGGQRGGRAGARRGGGGGGGRGTWGNPEWRKNKLREMAEENAAELDTQAVRSIVDSFVASGRTEQLVSDVHTKGDMLAVEALAQQRGLYR